MHFNELSPQQQALLLTYYSELFCAKRSDVKEWICSDAISIIIVSEKDPRLNDTDQEALLKYLNESSLRSR